MTDDATTTWLLRLQALTVAERPALLREMSRHEVEAVVLRLMAEGHRLRASIEATELFLKEERER